MACHAFSPPSLLLPVAHPLPDAGPSPPLFVRWLELSTFLLSPCPHFLLPLFAGFLFTQAGFLSLVWFLAASAPLLFSSWVSLLEALFSPSRPHLHPGVHLASVSVAWLLPVLPPCHTTLDACRAQAEGPGMCGDGRDLMVPFPGLSSHFSTLQE